MNKNILATILMLSMAAPAVVTAQDGRQRTVTTIVQDALAQLPAPTAGDLKREMADILSSAPESVEILASMLVPAAEGNNALVEYALNGVVNHVGTEGNAKYVKAVKTALANAASKCHDIPNRIFLLTQLKQIATAEDIPVFMEYVKAPETASLAIGALIGIEGSEPSILELIKAGEVSRPLLAYAAAEKRIVEAEPYILGWAADLDGNTVEDSDVTSKSDTPDLRSYCNSLSQCGTAASLKFLRKNSVYDYMTLLGRLAEDGDVKTALSGASKMLKADDVNLRSAALEIVLGTKGKEAVKELLAAVKSDDREYRCAALEFAEAFADDEVYSAVANLAAGLSPVVKVDVLNWLGENHVGSQFGFIYDCLKSGEDSVVYAAIGAAGKIASSEASDLLTEMLGSSNKDYSDAAYRSLLSLNKDISRFVSDILESGGKDRLYALKLASVRRMKSLSGQVFSLLADKDTEISDAAYKALAGVVTEKDSDKINSLFTDGLQTDKVASLQKALCAALSDYPAEEQFKTVEKYVNAGGTPVLYYPVLAQAGSCKKAVKMLADGYESGAADDAFKALMKVSDYNAADILLSIAAKDKNRSETALRRFIVLVSSSSLDNLSKVQKYSDVMRLEPSVKVRNSVLAALKSVPVMPAFLLASKSLDNPETSYKAADAVKTIASKTTDEVDYNALKSSLEKAMKIYEEAGGADDGYAVDEIKKMLAGLQAPAEKFVLSEDEAKAGYEVLFDGTDLSKWTGNTEGYTPVNGTIFVTANYGNEKNLYTIKEYSDFVFRFEFCFVKPGVNNGVGIRTPMGKDAAYWGMCEVQILDHDDPIYKNLKEYQVHGSAYGIIPAKRVVHKPLGEWNYEEIRVVGDRITVTLNGEVILDGNLRKACKGHNVAPDGGKKNPYTVDHRNHPGMFNEKGHVGFLGHGAGIKFRNVRILDLSK